MNNTQKVTVTQNHSKGENLVQAAMLAHLLRNLPKRQALVSA